MKLFRPDSSGFVRNIQVDSVQRNSKGSTISGGRIKKAVNEKDHLFWVPSSKIVEIKKNGQGFTTNIHLASGTIFRNIHYLGKITLNSKKQGLSKVSHHVDLVLSEDDDLNREAKDILSRNINISILHIDRYGDGFLYGEVKGLLITEFESGHLVLEGSEDNVFYEMTQECLQRAVPIKE